MTNQSKQKQMYNPEYKQEYLSTIKSDSTVIVVESLFVISASIEKMLNKDLCEFIFSDFIMLFERCGFVKGYNLPNRKSMIRSYIAWCVSKKYCSPNSLVEIERLQASDVNGYHVANSKYFRSLDDLLDCIEQVYKAVSSDVSPTLYEPLQMFYGLYWYGLESSEIFNLKTEQIDSHSGNTITLENKAITVSDRFMQLSINVSKYSCFITLHNQAMPYVESKYVFKSTKAKMAGEPITVNFHTSKHRVWMSLMESVPVSHPYYGKILSTISIAESGRFYRYYQDEKSGAEINADYMAKQLGTSEKNYSTPKFELRNYQMWKRYCEAQLNGGSETV